MLYLLQYILINHIQLQITVYGIYKKNHEKHYRQTISPLEQQTHNYLVNYISYYNRLVWFFINIYVYIYVYSVSLGGIIFYFLFYTRVHLYAKEISS